MMGVKSRDGDGSPCLSECLLYAAICMMGLPVEVQVQDGSLYSGILHAASFDEGHGFYFQQRELLVMLPEPLSSKLIILIQKGNQSHRYLSIIPLQGNLTIPKKKCLFVAWEIRMQRLILELMFKGCYKILLIISKKLRLGDRI